MVLCGTIFSCMLFRLSPVHSIYMTKRYLCCCLHWQEVARSVCHNADCACLVSQWNWTYRFSTWFSQTYLRIHLDLHDEGHVSLAIVGLWMREISFTFIEEITLLKQPVLSITIILVKLNSGLDISQWLV